MVIVNFEIGNKEFEVRSICEWSANDKEVQSKETSFL